MNALAYTRRLSARRSVNPIGPARPTSPTQSLEARVATLERCVLDVSKAALEMSGAVTSLLDWRDELGASDAQS